MTPAAALGIRWMHLDAPPADSEEGADRVGNLWLRVACPHCTNNDTLTLHCADDRCGWVRCTCGALIYSQRRHRHPRHGSGRDTCHDPAAAV